MPLPVPIDRGVHTTRTALPDCARTRESATVRISGRVVSTRGDGGSAAQSANTTIAPRRAVYGSAPGDGGGDDTRWGHLISCHFQFRRLEISPPARALVHSNAHARQPRRTLPPLVAGGDNNNIIYTNFKWSRRGVGTRVFPYT